VRGFFIEKKIKKKIEPFKNTLRKRKLLTLKQNWKQWGKEDYY
jgi:hypothetical protein